MSQTQLVNELILRWMELKDQGQETSIESLCADRPELMECVREGIKAVKSLERYELTVSKELSKSRIHIKKNGPAQAIPAAIPVDPKVGSRPPAGKKLPQIPSYQILAELGRGGMGVVYKAQHLALKRMVALKVILAGEYAGSEQIVRFRREAEAVAKLQHPNIIQIFEVGEHNGQPFFSLEFVDGGSLADRVNGTPLPPRQAAIIVETVANAIHYAHEQGIIHRDLKPANVLITKGKFQLKIGDFGLAKQSDATTAHTQSGAVMGTPSYMAPEQASGKIDQIGPRTDVFALGAILYEMLTGRPPFRGTSIVETLEQVRAKEPVSPRQIQPKIGLDLETICLKTLQKETNKRYSNARELANDLRRYLSNEPIVARPVSTGERLWRWGKRNRLVASLVLSVFMLIFAFAVGATIAAVNLNWSRNQESIAKDKAIKLAEKNNNLAIANKNLADNEMKARVRAQVKENIATGLRHAAERNLYIYEIMQAQSSWNRGAIGLCKELLAKYADTADGKDYRSFEWHYLSNLCHRSHLKFGTHKYNVLTLNSGVAVALSKDESKVYSAGRDYQIRCWNLATSDMSILGKHKYPVRCFAVSSDGRFAASGGGATYGQKSFGEVHIWDLETGNRVGGLPAFRKEVESIEFGSNNMTLYVWNGGDELALWDVKRRQVIRRLKLSMGKRVVTKVSAVIEPKQNCFIMAGLANPSPAIRDLESNTELVKLEGHRGGIMTAAFSPDGNVVATGGADGKLKLWNVKSGKELAELFDRDDAVHALAFSGDGKRIAAGIGNGISVWNIVKKKEMLYFRGHESAISSLVFSIDASRLVSGCFGGTVRVWDCTVNQTKYVLENSFGISDAELVSNGSVLAAKAAWSLAVWDLEKKSLITTSPPTKKLWALAGASENNIVAVAYGSEIEIRDLSRKKTLKVLRGHTGKVQSLAVNSDGTIVASAESGKYGGAGINAQVKIWDVRSGKEIRRIKKGMLFDLFAVDIDRSGKLLAIGHTQPWVALNSGRRTPYIHLWDIKQPKKIASFAGDFPVSFSFDGKRIAVCESKNPNAIGIYDTASGSKVKVLKGHGSAVKSLSFGRGDTLVSGSSDKTIKLWDVTVGRERATYSGHKREVSFVELSPGMNYLISASMDGTIHIRDGRSRLSKKKKVEN